MIPLENISLLLIVVLAVTGVLIAAFFKILYSFIFPLIDNRRLKRFFNTWIFRLELVVWLAFSIYSIYRLLFSSPVITLVLILLILVLGWNFWRDVISGIIFKMGEKVKVGDTISILGEKGTIDEIGVSNLILRTHQGVQTIIPFRKLEAYSIIMEQGKDNILHYTIPRIKMELFGGEQELKKLIMAWPWASPKHEPKIVPFDDENMEILVWATDPGVRENLISYILSEIPEQSEME
jgi:hypothetical protein